jgi:hypothetical protein
MNAGASRRDKYGHGFSVESGRELDFDMKRPVQAAFGTSFGPGLFPSVAKVGFSGGLAAVVVVGVAGDFVGRKNEAVGGRIPGYPLYFCELEELAGFFEVFFVFRFSFGLKRSGFSRYFSKDRRMRCS